MRELCNRRLILLVIYHNFGYFVTPCSLNDTIANSGELLMELKTVFCRESDLRDDSAVCDGHQAWASDLGPRNQQVLDINTYFILLRYITVDLGKRSPGKHQNARGQKYHTALVSTE